MTTGGGEDRLGGLPPPLVKPLSHPAIHRWSRRCPVRYHEPVGTVPRLPCTPRLEFRTLPPPTPDLFDQVSGQSKEPARRGPLGTGQQNPREQSRCTCPLRCQPTSSPGRFPSSGITFEPDVGACQLPASEAVPSIEFFAVSSPSLPVTEAIVFCADLQRFGTSAF